MKKRLDLVLIPIKEQLLYKINELYPEAYYSFNSYKGTIVMDIHNFFPSITKDVLIPIKEQLLYKINELYPEAYYSFNSYKGTIVINDHR